MNADCASCWAKDHPPPSDFDGLHRYKQTLIYMYQAEHWDDQSRYQAHRDAWAETGDLDELKRMLRHVGDTEPQSANWMKTESIGDPAWVPWAYGALMLAVLTLIVIAGLRWA